MSDPLANVLVQGNCVAETRAPRVRRRREKTIVRRMPSIYIRVGNAAKDSDVIAMFLKHLKIGGQGVIAATVLGKEVVRQQAEVVANAKHSARLPAGGSS